MDRSDNGTIDLDALAHFAAVVDAGGFSAAERALGVPKSRLSRHVAALEQALGVRLLQRSTRRFAVTDLGREVYRHAVNMRSEADAAREVVERARREPQGLLRVSAPVSVAEQELPRLLPGFLARYPGARVQVLVGNRRVDVIEEGIDVALRVRTRLDSDQSLVLRQFGAIRSLLVASPDYLARHGAPDAPDALAIHALLSMSEDDGSRWPLVHRDGHATSVTVRPRIMARNFPLLLQLAEQGAGIALLPESACADAVRQGRLVVVLRDWSLPEGIFHAVYPSRRGMLPLVRAFIDLLAEQLPPLIAESRLACSSAAAGAPGTLAPAAPVAAARPTTRRRPRRDGRAV